jgi:hypothetical protein
VSTSIAEPDRNQTDAHALDRKDPSKTRLGPQMLPDVAPMPGRIVLALTEAIVYLPIAIDIISFFKNVCLSFWKIVVDDRVAFYDHLQELDENADED